MKDTHRGVWTECRIVFKYQGRKWNAGKSTSSVSCRVDTAINFEIAEFTKQQTTTRTTTTTGVFHFKGSNNSFSSCSISIALSIRQAVKRHWALSPLHLATNSYRKRLNWYYDDTIWLQYLENGLIRAYCGIAYTTNRSNLSCVPSEPSVGTLMSQWHTTLRERKDINTLENLVIRISRGF